MIMTISNTCKNHSFTGGSQVFVSYHPCDAWLPWFGRWVAEPSTACCEFSESTRWTLLKWGLTISDYDLFVDYWRTRFKLTYKYRSNQAILVAIYLLLVDLFLFASVHCRHSKPGRAVSWRTGGIAIPWKERGATRSNQTLHGNNM